MTKNWLQSDQIYREEEEDEPEQAAEQQQHKGRVQQKRLVLTRFMATFTLGL